MPKGKAAIVMVVSPEGTPLVRETAKPEPHYWKLPGGKCEPEETIEQCAIRELFGETGVWLEVRHLVHIEDEDRGSHIRTAFLAVIPSMPRLEEQGHEGEEIRVFPTNEILNLDLLPNQRRIVEKALAILPTLV